MNNDLECSVNLANVQLYRWHSRKHFHSEPPEFYKNFLETRRTLLAQYRFAGTELCSGFYFGCSREVVESERRFYAPNGAAKESLLLRVTADLSGLLDLRDAANVREVLDRTYQPSFDLNDLHALDLLRSILMERGGGDGLTDLVGYRAQEWGYTGVIFPSVRKLEARELEWSGYGLHHLTKITHEDMSGETAAMKEQLAQEWNVVLFHGSATTRAIRRYGWIDLNGHEERRENIHYGAAPEVLEGIRLQAKQALGLNFEEALAVGLEADVEIEAGLRPLHFFLGTELRRGRERVRT